MKGKEGKGFAIASMVTSIIGLLLFLMPYIGIVFSIIAVVFAAKQKQSGMSTAGKVMGIIGIVINAIMLVFVGFAVLISVALA